MTKRKLVCSECGTESCAAGILMCENAALAALVMRAPGIPAGTAAWLLKPRVTMEEDEQRGSR